MLASTATTCSCNCPPARPPALRTAAFTCQDYFQGDANAKYTAILQTYDLQGLTPSVSCRQQGNTVHTLELVGAEPGERSRTAGAGFDHQRADHP